MSPVGGRGGEVDHAARCSRSAWRARVAAGIERLQALAPLPNSSSRKTHRTRRHRLRIGRVPPPTKGRELGDPRGSVHGGRFRAGRPRRNHTLSRERDVWMVLRRRAQREKLRPSPLARIASSGAARDHSKHVRDVVLDGTATAATNHRRRRHRRRKYRMVLLPRENRDRPRFRGGMQMFSFIEKRSDLLHVESALPGSAGPMQVPAKAFS